MNKNKPRIIKNFEKLDLELQQQVKLAYPEGFSDFLITFTDRDGMLTSGLPFETEDKIYLLRMNEKEANRIIKMDDDYDDDGQLKDVVRGEYEAKFGDMEDMGDIGGGDEEEEDKYADDDLGDDDFDDDDDDDVNINIDDLDDDIEDK